MTMSNPNGTTTMTSSSSAVAATTTIPSIDLSPFFCKEPGGIVVGDAPTAAQLDCARQMDAACRQHGFLHVTNFGISSELLEQAFSASQELFELPTSFKESSLKEWIPDKDVGYSKYRRESTNIARPPELKEAYSVRYPPFHKNDFTGCPEGFAEVATELLEKLQIASERYSMACALALGLTDDDITFFTRNIEKRDLFTLRFLHYPPCDFKETGVSTSKPLRIGEHADFGFVTFLLLPPGQGADGLQIKPVSGSETGGEVGGETEGWQDVIVPTDDGEAAGAIVNTGTLCARWTNDTWKATAHRVIVDSPKQASGHRYSIAYFVDPDADSICAVHDHFVSAASGEKKYEPISGLDYLLMKLNELANPKEIEVSETVDK